MASGVEATGQLYFEDFREGDSFFSAARTIGEAHFLFFSGITGDNHPLHYDIEYCRRLGLPERLSHGLLNVSLTALGATNLAPRVLESMRGFLSQSSNFLKPVVVGDTLQNRLVVTGLRPQRSTGLLTLRSELTNQRGELVLEGEQTYLVAKRAVPM